MSRNSDTNIGAFDIATARIGQAKGVIEAVLSGYTEQKVDVMGHILAPTSMVEALSAADELLDQALEAADKINFASTTEGTDHE